MQQLAIDPIVSRAFAWLALENGEQFLHEQEYCSSRDVFQGRLDHFGRAAEQLVELNEQYSLVTAVVGEIGNNAFDHNLGSWRDIPGIYFCYDLPKRLVVLADRGQGILASLRRVQPDLATDQAALEVAFTKMISGRAPERRGNGLKFVEAVVNQAGFSLECYSGTGRHLLGTGAHDRAISQAVSGVLVVFQF